MVSAWCHIAQVNVCILASYHCAGVIYLNVIFSFFLHSTPQCLHIFHGSVCDSEGDDSCHTPPPPTLPPAYELQPSDHLVSTAI